MKISYAIPFKDEEVLLHNLPLFLSSIPSQKSLVEYEIVLLWDNSGNQQYFDFFMSWIKELDPNIKTEVKLFSGKFANNFADWKNLLNSYCEGDWIVQLDADETITHQTFQKIETLLLGNDESEVECILVPRYNIVNGLTEDDCKRWGWKWQGEEGINFPDYQYRIYRKGMRWRNKVHEIIDATVYAHLPPMKEWCIIHEKSIERQRQQNDFYSRIG